jgi:hypothetical protein
MDVYKMQAKKATCKAQAQRVLREQAQAQRVSDEQQAAAKQASTQNTPTSFPAFEVEASYNKTGRPPDITQEEDSPPAANTHQQCQIQTLTQDYMFCMMEASGYTAPFTMAQAAFFKYPLQYLCDFAYEVLEDDTSDLLEYCHLIKHPEYKDTCSQLVGKEIRCLATTTEKIFFMNKPKIPMTVKVMSHTAGLYVSIAKAKRQALHKNQNGRKSHQLPQ